MNEFYLFCIYLIIYSLLLLKKRWYLVFPSQDLYQLNIIRRIPFHNILIPIKTPIDYNQREITYKQYLQHLHYSRLTAELLM